MAERSTSTTGPGRSPAQAPKAANDQGEVSLADLARGILSKEIRPRAADIRRLAEAVVVGLAKPKKSKDGGNGKKISTRPDDKGGKKKKKKKLAKIPGQKSK